MGIEVALVGLIASAAGGAIQFKSQRKAAKAQKAVTRESIKQEALRAKQAALERAQQQRAEQRAIAKEQSIANANATSAGAAEGSGLAGGQSAAMAAFAGNRGVQNQAYSIGQQMFASNAAEAGYLGQVATAQGMQQFGQQLFSVGFDMAKIGATGFGNSGNTAGMQQGNA